MNELNIIVLICEIVIAVVLLIINIRQSAKNKRYKKMLSLYKDRVREEFLDTMLHNEYYIFNNESANIAPYEIEFQEEKKAEKKDAICVHFECIGSLSTRKYVVNIEGEFFIGRAKTNGIVLKEQGIDNRHIHFIRQNNDLYVQNESSSFGMQLLRGKQQYNIGDTAVRINDKDVLQTGDTVIKIRLLFEE